MMEVAEPSTINVVQQQEEPASGAGTQQNGSEPNVVAVNGNSTVTPTATSTVETAIETKEYIDPRKDPFGWLQQLSTTAKHKVNYELLQWAQNQIVSDKAKRQPLPAQFTSNQFLSSLRDGVILAKLANTLAAGSVETVHEGECVKTNKENQVSNLQGFINFAKEKAGLAEDQVFTVADLQDNGKDGYKAVFNTLFRIAMRSLFTFNRPGIDVDKIAQEAGFVDDPNILQKVITYFRSMCSKAGTSAAEKSSVNNELNFSYYQDSRNAGVLVVQLSGIQERLSEIN